MIVIKNLSHAYHKGFPLYQGLCMELSSGSIYGLLGENGAGKSTLLKSIVGLLFPTSGSISVHGQQPQKRTPSALAEVFFIPENFELPNISIAQFLSLKKGFYPNFSKTDFQQYMKAFKVPSIKRIGQMSFGQQKKLMIAFALATNAKVLVMDEPTNGLDIAAKRVFRQLMAATITEERTYIISTHQVRDLETILDHVLILGSGQLLLNANAHTILEHLAFKVLPNGTRQEDYLYVEESILGAIGVKENTLAEETQLNLELLYGACVLHHKAIAHLFKSPANLVNNAL